MTPIKIIVFDFDNCIALDARTGEGSEEIKDRAWFDVFAEYEQHELADVIEKSKQLIVGGKGDRENIARNVLSHFEFSTETVDAEVVQRCNYFEQIVQENIERLDIPSATYETLRNLSARFSLYLNTATPKESIRKTLETLKLGMFKDVYGRPGTKIANLQSIINTEDIESTEMLFVGDMQSDFEAAQEVGCQFIGIRTKRNREWNESQTFPIIGSVAELEDLL